MESSRDTLLSKALRHSRPSQGSVCKEGGRRRRRELVLELEFEFEFVCVCVCLFKKVCARVP